MMVGQYQQRKPLCQNQFALRFLTVMQLDKWGVSSCNELFGCICKSLPVPLLLWEIDARKSWGMKRILFMPHPRHIELMLWRMISPLGNPRQR